MTVRLTDEQREVLEPLFALIEARTLEMMAFLLTAEKGWMHDAYAPQHFCAERVKAAEMLLKIIHARVELDMPWQHGVSGH